MKRKSVEPIVCEMGSIMGKAGCPGKMFCIQMPRIPPPVERTGKMNLILTKRSDPVNDHA